MLQSMSDLAFDFQGHSRLYVRISSYMRPLMYAFLLMLNGNIYVCMFISVYVLQGKTVKQSTINGSEKEAM